jgi:ribosomal protein S18 acetylase RimI-like enzyme
MTAVLRAIRPDDAEFLYELYGTTRQPELDVLGLDESQRELFLRFQFTAYERHYQTVLARAEQYIVELDGRRIGRYIVVRDPDELRLADLALLPEFRNHGIGAELVLTTMEEARQAGLPIRLQSEKTNPVRRFLDRLGFAIVGETDTHYQFEISATDLAARGRVAAG